ncbi:nucleotidyltransferase family protein [Mesorhizobium sp. 10J20-29]
MSVTAPPVADTLRVMLPSSHDGLFLRMLAGPQEDVREAWEAWLEPVRHLRPFLRGQRPDLKRLLPLAAYRLRQADVTVDMQHLLNAAKLWEEQRTRRILEIFSAVFDRLTEVGLHPTLVGGLANSASAYPEIALRHCHDIDILLPPDEVQRAARLLVEAGFERPDATLKIAASVSLRHADGLPINLHTSLLGSTYFRLPDKRMTARAVTLYIAGRSIDILPPEGALLHRLALATTDSAAEPISALVDAALILGTAGFDVNQWQHFIDDALSARLGPQLFTMLDYLRREVGATVSESVLRELAQSSRCQDAEWVDHALHHARYGHGGNLGAMLIVSNWRSRIKIVRWLVLPSPGYLRGWCSRRGLAWTPLWYVGRPFRRSVNRLARIGRSRGN